MSLIEQLEMLAGQDGVIIIALKTESKTLQEQNRVADVLRKAAKDNGATVLLATSMKITKEKMYGEPVQM